MGDFFIVVISIILCATGIKLLLTDIDDEYID